MSAILTARARVAALSRSRTDDDPDLVRARGNLKAIRLEEYVARAVAEAPPLTPEQRDIIIAAFGGFTPASGDA